jgi:WD40 repeat protein
MRIPGTSQQYAVQAAAYSLPSLVGMAIYAYSGRISIANLGEINVLIATLWLSHKERLPHVTDTKKELLGKIFLVSIVGKAAYAYQTHFIICGALMGAVSLSLVQPRRNSNIQGVATGIQQPFQALPTTTPSREEIRPTNTHPIYRPPVNFDPETFRVDDTDMTSTVPTEVALHILSYLSFEEIQRTHLVSKKWRHYALDDYLWHDRVNRDLPHYIHLKNDSMTWRELYIRMQRCFSPEVFKHMSLHATLQGHRGAIQCSSFANKTFITGSVDTTIKIWDLQTKSCLHTLQGHTQPLLGLVHRDNMLASCAGDGTIRIWDLTNGHCIRVLNNHTHSYDLILKDNFLISSSGCYVKVWDWNTGAHLSTYQGHTNEIKCMAFWKNILVTGSWDCTVKVWNQAQGISTLQGHTGPVTHLIISNHLLVTGSEDHTVKIWNLETKQCLRTLVGHTSGISCLAIQGDLLVTGAWDSKVKIWSLTSGKCLHTLDRHSASIGRLLIRGNTLITSADYEIKIWNLKSGALIHTLQGHKGYIDDLYLENDTLITPSRDHTVKVWKISE